MRHQVGMTGQDPHGIAVEAAHPTLGFGFVEVPPILKFLFDRHPYRISLDDFPTGVDKAHVEFNADIVRGEIVEVDGSLRGEVLADVEFAGDAALHRLCPDL